MEPLAADDAIREHLQRNPGAQQSALHDPQYAAELHRLRQVLGHLDAALAAEDMSTEARQRVGARLVRDCLGTDAVNARVRSVQKLLAQGVVRVPAGW